MSVLLKHIWRNIKDKKLMSVLIIFSLTVSGSLLFVSLSIGGILDKVAGNDFQSASTVFILVFIVTCFMSVFVVYSSFKYIMALRIKTVGTFRSVGASKGSARRLLLIESIAYGLISAAFAVIAGIALLAFLSSLLSGGKAVLTVSFTDILICIVFCLLLSPACAYLPVKASEKFSVKEIILQTSSVKERRRLPFLFAGLLLIIIGLCFMLLPEFKYEEAFIIIALIMILAGFVMSVSPVLAYTFAFISFLFPDNLTVKTLKNSKAYRNIGVLLSIAAAVVFMINSANMILAEATDNSFTLYDYDVVINGAGLDADALAIAEAAAGNAEGVYLKTGVEVSGHIPLMNLYGVKDEVRKNYFKFTTLVTEEHPLENPVILSSDYMVRGGLSIADKITVNGIEFTVSGIVAEMFNSGNVGFISEEAYRTLFNETEYTSILVKSETPSIAAAALSAALPDAAVTTVDEMLTSVKQINTDLFTVLDYLILLSTVAGVFGVLNNLLIAFNSQKREIALLRSLGMSKVQSGRAIVLESLLTGLFGGILGLAGGLLLTTVVPAVMVVFEFAAAAVPVSVPAVLICVACSTAICVISSLFSLIGNSKMKIVQTLREEIL